MFRVLCIAAVLVAVAATRAGAVSFATEIFADPGVGVSSGNTSRYTPSNALGPTPANTLSSFWSGGIGGVSIFGFGRQVMGGGRIVEATGSCGAAGVDGLCSGSGHREQAKLYAISGSIDFGALGAGTLNGETIYDLSGIFSDPGLDLFEVADIQNGEAQGSGFAFDLTAARSALGAIDYLMVVDRTGLIPGTQSTDGFDIVSISATPVPLPPAMLSLGVALAGFGLIARRRRG